MRKLFVISIVSVFVSLNLSVFAQDALKKGVYSLSGGVSFLSSTNESIWETTNFLEFSFSPTINYFIIDNFSAGVSISFGYYQLSFNDSNNKNKYINRPISLGASARYYFSNEKFIPFVEGGYSYGNSLSGNEDMNAFNLACGVNYFLTKSAAIEPYLEYRRSSFIEAEQKVSGIAFGVRINYFIVD